MNKPFALIAAVATLAVLMLAGCNTIEGIGKDVKKTGEVIEKTADKAKN